MLLTIIHLVLIAFILIAPLKLYRSGSVKMMDFYQRMSYSINCRKFYARILLLTVIIFHFVYYWMKPGEFGVMLSSLAIAYLFSVNRTIDLLHSIRNSKCMTFTFFIATLAMLFIPHMYSTGATMSYILVAAMFYPSDRIDRMKGDCRQFPTYKELTDDTIRNYYS